jgi:14-3-3 protein epsilon
MAFKVSTDFLKDSDGDLNNLNVNLMKIYDLTENYEEMINCVFNLSVNYDINNDEIEILTRCFKSLIGMKRKQHRKIIALIYKETLNDNKNEIALLNILKENLSNEIINLCEKVVQICLNFLKTSDENDKNKKIKLYFVKNVADHYRYIFELTENEDHKSKATEFYNKALNIAETGKFLPTDIIYLTFFLNYTVYLYDVMDNKAEAIRRSKIVLNSALKDTEEITENSQRDIILLCQMIKDNLALWKHNNL